MHLLIGILLVLLLLSALGGMVYGLITAKWKFFCLAGGLLLLLGVGCVWWLVWFFTL